jgi:hypothetical protein
MFKVQLPAAFNCLRRLRVQGSIAFGVQGFKVQLPAAFKGSRFNCLRRSIACGV